MQRERAAEPLAFVDVETEGVGVGCCEAVSEEVTEEVGVGSVDVRRGEEGVAVEAGVIEDEGLLEGGGGKEVDCGEEEGYGEEKGGVEGEGSVMGRIGHITRSDN